MKEKPCEICFKPVDLKDKKKDFVIDRGMIFHKKCYEKINTKKNVGFIMTEDNYMEYLKRCNWGVCDSLASIRVCANHFKSIKKQGYEEALDDFRDELRLVINEGMKISDEGDKRFKVSGHLITGLNFSLGLLQEFKEKKRGN